MEVSDLTDIRPIQPMFDFTVLVLDGAFPTGVAVSNDILAAATKLAPRVGAAVPRWRMCSMEGGEVKLSGGLTVMTSKLPTLGRGDRSTWVLPGLEMNTSVAVRHRLQCGDARQAAKALARHVSAGGRVAASCSAVSLLQAAGLLHGRRATTTWWLAPLLKRMNPDCLVDADRMVCADGPVVTAGAAFAQTDLLLHLLREQCGRLLVELVSRMLLIDGRQAQAPFILPEMMARVNDLVARLAARIESALPNPPTVTELALEFCMSERTLARRVHVATGKSTMAIFQSVKLRRARALLETSRKTVDQVAVAVGYQDSTALRRLMKKVSGVNSSRYRPTVAAL